MCDVYGFMGTGYGVQGAGYGAQGSRFKVRVQGAGNLNVPAFYALDKPVYHFSDLIYFF